jgi:hypothetical protein
MKARRAFRFLWLAALVACNRPTHGKIVGDAYIAEDVGREVNLVGAPVHLIAEPDRDTANLDSTLANICVQRDRFIAQAGPGAEAVRSRTLDAYQRAWRARNRLLQGMARRDARTNARAQFLLDSIEPGKYRVWSDTLIAGEHWTWLEQVAIEAGDSIRLNLTNGNVDTNPFRCRPREE